MKTTRSTISSAFTWILLAGTTAAMTACGGGGGSSSSSSILNVSGTAAVGKALDGAAISVQCKQGSGAGTAAANGDYSVDVVNGKGPCLVSATKNSTTLHSVTPGAGVANITPLTDLLTNYLATRAGTSVSNLLSNTTGTAILSDTNAINQAQTDVVNIIKTSYNVTISTSNFLTTTIITTPATQNNADKDLDLLKSNSLLGSNDTPTKPVVDTINGVATSKPTYVPTTGATGSTS